MSSLVFTFGKFNPPTIAHELLFDYVETLSGELKCDNRVVISGKALFGLNTPDNIDLLKRLHPNLSFNVASRDKPGLIHQIKLLDGFYDDLIVVCGGDRKAEYSTLFEKYNNIEYKFKSIKVVSVGNRNPDDESIEGVSSTKLRTAIRENDYSTFCKLISPKLCQKEALELYNKLKLKLV